jgi:hypothetical protein
MDTNKAVTVKNFRVQIWNQNNKIKFRIFHLTMPFFVSIIKKVKIIRIRNNVTNELVIVAVSHSF